MTKKLATRGAILVTGAARRIGRAISLSLASLGYQIAIHYHRSGGEAKKLAEEIQKKGGRCQLFQCDLSDEQQTEQLISTVRQKFPNLNVLINNASLFEPSTIKNLHVTSLRRHFAVNFDAPCILTAKFARECKKGHIINILDTHIVNNATQHATYLLSKKALYELTKLSAIELAPDIRVNAVSPGFILSPVHSNSVSIKKLTRKIPLKRKGHVDHIAQSIAFLINNPYITGQVIFTDGGEHLT